MQSFGSRPREGGAQLALPVVDIGKFLLVVCEPIRPRTWRDRPGPGSDPKQLEETEYVSRGLRVGCALRFDGRVALDQL